MYQGDLFDALPTALRGRVDVLVANVPYVPSDAIAMMPPEARDYEPRVTLDGGADGLDVLRRVAAPAPAVAEPGRPAADRDERGQASSAVAVFGRGGLRGAGGHR